MLRFPRRTAAGLLAATLGLTFAAALAAPADKGELKSLSYDDLGKRVRSLEGKVVVVYFWSFG